MNSKMNLAGSVWKIIAVAILGFAWGHDSAPALIVLSLFLPLFVLNAKTRVGAFVLALIYYAASSRGLVEGSFNFFGSDASAVFKSLSLFVVACSLSAAVWCLGWNSDSSKLFFRSLICLFATALPPVGLIAWTHPVTSAGWIYPGLGVLGMFLTVVASSAIASKNKSLIVILFSISVCSSILFSDPPVSVFDGRDTKLGDVAKNPWEGLKRIELEAEQAAPGGRIVLPETIAGRLEPVSLLRLKSLQESLEHKDVMLIFGAERPLDRDNYQNGVVVIGSGGPRFIEQRMPIPIGMWKPWGDSSALASLGTGVVELAGKRVAVSVCYEQLLPFWSGISVSQRPEIWISVSNVWWASSTSIPAIQSSSSQSWARLSGARLVTAKNI